MLKLNSQFTNDWFISVKSYGIIKLLNSDKGPHCANEAPHGFTSETWKDWDKNCEILKKIVEREMGKSKDCSYYSYIYGNNDGSEKFKRLSSMARTVAKHCHKTCGLCVSKYILTQTEKFTALALIIAIRGSWFQFFWCPFRFQVCARLVYDSGFGSKT